MYFQNVPLFKLIGSKGFSLVIATLLLVASSSSTVLAAGDSPEFDSVSFTRYSGRVYVSGYIDDPDDDVDGWILELGGSVSGSVVVNGDGWFSIDVADPGQQSIFVVIQAEDPNGNTAADGEWLY